MAFQTASVGALAQLGMGPASPVTEMYEFVRENFTKQKQIVETAGIRGTRSRVVERLRDGTYVCSGDIEMTPSPDEWNNLWPRILGGSKVGATFSPTEVLPFYVVTVDRISKVFTYLNCRCSKATLRASEGSALSLVMSTEGETETLGNAGTFPALTILAQVPYVMMDASLTLGGTVYQFKEWECTIDNHLNTTRFMNSISRTDLPAIDREITTNWTVPATSDTIPSLYDWSAQSPITGNITFTNGARSMILTFASLVTPTRAPAVQSKDEILMQLPLLARKSGSTLEIVVTNN